MIWMCSGLAYTEVGKLNANIVRRKELDIELLI